MNVSKSVEIAASSVTFDMKILKKVCVECDMDCPSHCWV